MTSFVGVPVADAGVPGDTGEPVVEPVAGVGAAVGVAEDEVAVVPGLAGGEPFGGSISLTVIPAVLLVGLGGREPVAEGVGSPRHAMPNLLNL